MACKGCEARRRYLINGVTSAATTLHTKYIKPAREFLEAMKQQMKLGGLQQLTQRYENEDGVKFTAASRFGQDEMIIDVPVTGGGGEEKEEPKEKGAPYLWVGARMVYTPDSDMTPGQFLLMVIEPGKNQLVVDEQAAWRQVNDGATTPWLLEEHTATFTTAGVPLDISAQDTNFRAHWPWVPVGRNDYKAVASGGSLIFTKHLLRHYGIASIVVDGNPDNLIQPPHDPLGTPEQLAARVPNQYGSYGTQTLWDQVVVADPDEGGAPPTSRRPKDLEALKLLSKATGIGIPNCILPGDYIIKVMAVGVECKWSNTPFPNNYDWNENVVNYMQPMTIEVEVRVGKAPHTLTKKFTTVLSAYSEQLRDVWPFGNFTPIDVQQCVGGDNPHGPWWSQSAILANPIANAIRLTNDVPDVFVPSQTFSICNRQYWDIYVAVFQPWCAYATGSYASEVANQIYNGLVVNARRETYGPVDVPLITQAQIAAAAAVVIDSSTGEGLYHYDYPTNTFTKFAVGSYDTSLSTLDPVGAGHEVWEDIFRQQSLMACRGYAAVKLGLGSPVYDGFVHVDDPQWVQDAVLANCGCDSYGNTNAWHEVGQP